MKKFIKKILSFANSLAEDYYNRVENTGKKQSQAKLKTAKSKVKGQPFSVHGEGTESYGSGI